ncbi:MAG: hypothetical protein IJS90_03475, partial [Clostridia bacterium]|nr:hypothetical protein [Clostridia bacterium]
NYMADNAFDLSVRNDRIIDRQISKQLVENKMNRPQNGVAFGPDGPNYTGGQARPGGPPGRGGGSRPGGAGRR